jgi:hypothetical protein
MIRHRRAATLLGAWIVLGVVLGGCGSGGDSATGNSAAGFGPNVVTDGEIAGQPEGSPQRALLEWWQAFQFADVQGVTGLTSKETRQTIGDAELAKLVKARGPGLQGIEILSATATRSSAAVRAGLLTFTPSEPGGPAPATPTSATPATFTMIKQGGQWLFADADYLAPIVEGLEQRQAQAQQGGS